MYFVEQYHDGLRVFMFRRFVICCNLGINQVQRIEKEQVDLHSAKGAVKLLEKGPILN